MDVSWVTQKFLDSKLWWVGCSIEWLGSYEKFEVEKEGDMEEKLKVLSNDGDDDVLIESHLLQRSLIGKDS